MITSILRIIPMERSALSSRSVRFGVFEVDLEAGQLFKKGRRKIKPQEQPLQVLAMLLERPGQIARNPSRSQHFP